MNGFQRLIFRVILCVLVGIVLLAACKNQPISGTETSPESSSTIASPTTESIPTETLTTEPIPTGTPAKIEAEVIEPTMAPPIEMTIEAPITAEDEPPVQVNGDDSQEEVSTESLLAEIEYFEASPATLHPGEITELRWNASGESAEICPVTRYTYFSEDDCQSVPLTGSLQFTIPDDLQPSYDPGFRLYVEGEEGTESRQQFVYVQLNCPINWFFDPEQAVGPLCPQQTISSPAAVQHFEHGTMIWLESLGRYYIFYPQSLDQSPLDQHEQFIQIDDPLTILDDTSGNFTPPSGLYAPESGFGLVWRGDVTEGSPLLDTLGWATSPEFGYEAFFQCSELISIQFGAACYLIGPEDELVWIDASYNRWQRLR